MHRLNLIPKEVARESKLRLAGTWVAIVLTVCHVTALGWAGLFAWSRGDDVAGLVAEERELQAKLAVLDDGTDPDVLSGALTARDAWFAEKQRSPVRFLAMLEAGQPSDGLLLRADLTCSGGRATVVVPNRSMTEAWFRSIGSSGTRHAEIEGEPSPEGEVTVAWSWTD